MLKFIRDEINSNVHFTFNIMKDIGAGAKTEVLNLCKEAKSEIFNLIIKIDLINKYISL